MPTTPYLALPYPAPSDTPDVAYWQQQLADEVEAAVIARGAWVAYTPSLAGTGWALGNGTLTGRYTRIQDTIIFQARLVIGSTTTKGSGQLNIGLPSSVRDLVGYYLAQCIVHDISPNAWFPGTAIMAQNAAAAALFSAAGAAVNSTAPITFATGDEVFVTGTYEEV